MGYPIYFQKKHIIEIHSVNASFIPLAISEYWSAISFSMYSRIGLETWLGWVLRNLTRYLGHNKCSYFKCKMTFSNWRWLLWNPGDPMQRPLDSGDIFIRQLLDVGAAPQDLAELQFGDTFGADNVTFGNMTEDLFVECPSPSRWPISCTAT